MASAGWVVKKERGVKFARQRDALHAALRRNSFTSTPRRQSFHISGRYGPKQGPHGVPEL